MCSHPPTRAVEGKLEVTVTSLKGKVPKCPRCYRYCGIADNYLNLCDRCTLVIIEDYPESSDVLGIRECWKKQKEKYYVRIPRVP